VPAPPPPPPPPHPPPARRVPPPNCPPPPPPPSPRTGVLRAPQAQALVASVRKLSQLRRSASSPPAERLARRPRQHITSQHSTMPSVRQLQLLRLLRQLGSGPLCAVGFLDLLGVLLHALVAHLGGACVCVCVSVVCVGGRGAR
jgi:hypothetical protein